MFQIRYFRFIFSFFMAFFMSFIISAVLTFINLGFIENFVFIWLVNWLKALVVAYPCVLVVAPFATMLTKAICKEK